MASCRWLILWTFLRVSLCLNTHILTYIAALDKKRHSRTLTVPRVVLSACSYILSLIHYQWGCSRKCCLITSHSGLCFLSGAFEATGLCQRRLFLSKCPGSPRNPLPVRIFCFQADPDLTVCVLLVMMISNLLFTRRHKSNSCFVLVQIRWAAFASERTVLPASSPQTPSYVITAGSHR